jgi:hypothetical protein
MAMATAVATARAEMEKTVMEQAGMEQGWRRR